MNSLKQTAASLFIVSFILLFVLPVAVPVERGSAQTGDYDIVRVDHEIQVMYSGNIVIVDTIHLSGQVSGEFTVGLPFRYSAYLLKTLAYDESHIYDVNLGVPLTNRSGFYGVEVDFEGDSPSVFAIAFVLSNSLISGDSGGNFTLDFPAYPCFTKEVGTCNVAMVFPRLPNNIIVSKEDGDVKDTNYAKDNLRPYTYSIATATIQVPARSLLLATISSLSRQITLDATGTVRAIDNYSVISNATSPLGSFVLSLPMEATNVLVKDGSGEELSTILSTPTSSNIILANTTLSNPINKDGAVALTASYNLPGATHDSAKYVLDFQLFPNFQYLVQQATMTFAPPEGATIVAPQVSSLDIASTLTRNPYQDILTITKESISYVDYLAPQQNSIQLSYDYNPVWVSLRPTFLASLVATIGCVGAVFYRRIRPKDERFATRSEQLVILKPSIETKKEKAPPEVIKTGEPVTAEDLKRFIDAYEDKKQLKAELRSLETRAQKGKIPRRQHKVQKLAIDTRMEGLTKSIENAKAVFRGSSGTYPDIVKQLDQAEEDLTLAEENLKTLETYQLRGEISIETYKKNIGDYQKARDKAESAINGILLRLREKIR